MNINSIKAADPTNGIILNSDLTNSLVNAIKRCSESGCTPVDAEANAIYIDENL